MSKGQRAGDGAIAVNVEEGKSYYWCSCGKSSKQPFCDGSHKGSEFNPIVYKVEATKKMFFCACKQTNNPPFCDGSHNKQEMTNILDLIGRIFISIVFLLSGFHKICLLYTSPSPRDATLSRMPSSA